jgi:hypothetical protein
MESLLSGIGVTIAAALIMLAAIALYGSTGPADIAIMLQTAAADVCGDIGTVAASTVPCAHRDTISRQGVGIRITSDYVVACGPQGMEFARPLAVRVYPGNYQGPDGACWNGTEGMHEYFNATFGRPGTKESPLSVDNGSRAAALLEKSSLDMVSDPVYADQSLPLTIEKLFVFVNNASSGIMECEPYVFVYQR